MARVLSITTVIDTGRVIGVRKQEHIETGATIYLAPDDKEQTLNLVWSLLNNTANLRSVIISPKEIP